MLQIPELHWAIQEYFTLSVPLDSKKGDLKKCLMHEVMEIVSNRGNYRN